MSIERKRATIDFAQERGRGALCEREVEGLRTREERESKRIYINEGERPEMTMSYFLTLFVGPTHNF